MSDTTSYAQDKYISLDKAVRLLDVSFERITWFIATSRLAWKRDPRDGNRKLVSLLNLTFVLARLLRLNACTKMNISFLSSDFEIFKARVWS